MKLIHKTSLLPIGIVALLVCGASIADLLDGKRVQISAKDENELIKKVLGQNHPVWEFSGEKWMDGGKVLDRRAEVVYQPFKSSDIFCRTYVTSIKSPAWMCNEDSCSESSSKTYSIETRAYLSDIRSKNITSCNALNFKADYFALESNLHDNQVMELLYNFENTFNKWKDSNGEEYDGFNRDEISSHKLISLEVLPRGDIVLARFMLQHPESEPARLVFDLEIDSSKVIDYRVYVMMP